MSEYKYKSKRQKENKEEYNAYMKLGLKTQYKTKQTQNTQRMKVKLSNNETYEMSIPAEMTGQEFLDFTDKLEKVIKLVKLSGLGNLNEFREKFNSRNLQDRKPYTRTKPYNARKPNFYDSREKVLDIMQYFYHGTKGDRERIAKLTGKPEDEIVKRFFNLKRIYNIQPEEIGFKVFGTRIIGGSSKGIRIPNYIIKSHTGIFDENGKE